MSDKALGSPDEQCELTTEAAERHEPLLRETLDENAPATEFTQADWDELRERAKRAAATAKQAMP